MVFCTASPARHKTLVGQQGCVQCASHKCRNEAHASQTLQKEAPLLSFAACVGTTGWYAQYNQGAPKYHEIWLSQVSTPKHRSPCGNMC
jgi:hypothetical protein